MFKNPFRIIAYLILIIFSSALLLLPSEVFVRYETEMEAPVDSVFGAVNNIKTWQHWSPWKFDQAHIKTKYEGPESGKSAKYVWTSDSLPQMNGRLEITKSEKNKQIRASVFYDANGEEPVYESELYFKDISSNGSKMKSTIAWELKDDVSWFHLPNRFLLIGAEEELMKMIDSSFKKLSYHIQNK